MAHFRLPRYGGRCRTVLAWSVISCLLAPRAVTAEPSQTVVSRIFLQQGETLVAYGGYVRVGDRVVFSLPVSNLIRAHTQLVTVPASVVDWTATEQYAQAARASLYAATRGEADFVRLSAEVAETLNQIAFSPDPGRRRTLARDARRLLVSWTAANHGYREHDIHEVVALLDEAIATPGAPTSIDGLNLRLVGTTMRPPRVPLLPLPSLQEIVAKALAAARLTTVPAERLSVLQTVVRLLDDPSSALPDEWRQDRSAEVHRELRAELQTSRGYAALGRRALAEADTYAGRADVRGVQSIRDEMLAHDAQLGHGRPDFMSALVAAVDARLAAARSLRLARDRWSVRVDLFQEYEREVEQALTAFTHAEEMLDDVRLLAGPLPDHLGGLGDRLAELAATLDRMEPPLEVRQAHELYSRAVLLALGAVRGRHEAVQKGELAVAWAAASAAAGSILLFERATAELDGVLMLPELN